MVLISRRKQALLLGASLKAIQCCGDSDISTQGDEAL